MSCRRDTYSLWRLCKLARVSLPLFEAREKTCQFCSCQSVDPAAAFLFRTLARNVLAYGVGRSGCSSVCGRGVFACAGALHGGRRRGAGSCEPSTATSGDIPEVEGGSAFPITNLLVTRQYAAACELVALRRLAATHISRDFSYFFNTIFQTWNFPEKVNFFGPQAFAEALADATVAAQLEPRNSKALLRKGQAAFELENFELAKNAFEACPGPPPLRRNSSITPRLSTCMHVDTPLSLRRF